MTWGMLPMAYRVPALLDFPLFTLLWPAFSRPIAASCCWSPRACCSATWLLLKKTRVGLIIQAALTHPQMVSALGHNVPRVFTHRVRRRLPAGRARRRDRRQLPDHRTRHGRRHGADRVRRRGVRRARLAGGMLHRLDPDGHDPDLRGGDQRLAARSAASRSASRCHGDNLLHRDS